METEDSIFDDCSEGQIIEQICKVLPHIGVAVLAHALIIEAIDLGDLSTLMVASQNSDSISKPDLECH